LLAGFSATIAYLEVARRDGTAPRSTSARSATLFLEDAARLSHGLRAADDGGRVPTFLLNVEGVDATQAVTRLSEAGFGVWAHDNWYSLGLREKLPYPDSAIRVGLIHYNTAGEIDRFNAALAQL
jgi:selenocysteine lyase/cysteine desulfurase